jgi:nifR3 family TIM-barrel protein
MFLEKVKKPIVGLAPMDGVTDAVFRYMVCLHSRPSFVMTEFVNVEGLARGAVKKIPAFIFNEIERPIVAQIFGVEVDSFYKAAVLASALGFDGVDINMGCPAKKVEKKGSGAGLIKTPELARDIIWAVKRGVKDWAEGVTLEEAGVHSDVIASVKVIGKRVHIPVSVKTRIGYDKPVTEEWIGGLLEAGVDFLTLHGRTLKQMYLGEADWDEIGKAAVMCRKAGVMIIGNGDVKSMDDAEARIKEYGVDGVMVGRAAMGNPWFFGGDEPFHGDRVQAARDHLKYFEEFLGKHLAYHTVKKHLGWYLKGFDGARELRMQLMQTESAKEAIRLIDSI